MQWFEKPKTMEEVQQHKKSAIQVLLGAALLLCILMVAGIVGIASKLISIAIGLLLGAGLVRWLQARKVEEAFVAKNPQVQASGEAPAARTNEAATSDNTPSVVPAPSSQSQAKAGPAPAAGEVPKID